MHRIFITTVTNTVIWRQAVFFTKRISKNILKQAMRSSSTKLLFPLMSTTFAMHGWAWKGRLRNIIKLGCLQKRSCWSKCFLQKTLHLVNTVNIEEDLLFNENENSNESDGLTEGQAVFTGMAEMHRKSLSMVMFHNTITNH